MHTAPTQRQTHWSPQKAAVATGTGKDSIAAVTATRKSTASAIAGNANKKPIRKHRSMLSNMAHCAIRGMDRR